MKIKTQRNGHECGPIAVHNVFILLNKNPPPLKKLKEMLKTDKYGTSKSDMIKTLKELKILRSTKATEDVFYHYYVMGNPVLIGLQLDNEEGHYTVLKYEYDSDKHYAYNHATEDVLNFGSYKEYKKRMLLKKEQAMRLIYNKSNEIYVLTDERL